MRGTLMVFEGPDGVGKTTLGRRLTDYLTSKGVASRYISFPGHEPGTLGRLVYEIHHHPAQFGIDKLEPTTCQLLHVASHIDALHRTIRPALLAGEVVVMDRFWWSTLVYGRSGGANEESLSAMIDLEKRHWAGIVPAILFLLDRKEGVKPEHSADRFAELRLAYRELAEKEKAHQRVSRVSTEVTVEESLAEIISDVDSIVAGSNNRSSKRDNGTLALPWPRESVKEQAPIVFAKMSPAIASGVYDTYWRFAAERQEIFFRRVQHAPPPWTDDPVLLKFKFTNAYRASDRVSQFLIRNVIYLGSQKPEELFFRIILFKLFNKIETWSLLERELGPLGTYSFDLEAYDRILSRAMSERTTIYSGAYIMPSGGRNGETKKHRNHLKLLKTMLADNVPDRVGEMKKMQDVFELLRSYPMIGDFLAYQYATDLNYSPLTDFGEMEFVIPGPGAKDGIRKCFKDLGGLKETEIIRMVAEKQEHEFEQRGLDFKDLWERPLQLIDCQNLFCELDKYARYVHPDVSGISGRHRIKQKFRSTADDIDYWYPPKWHINERVIAEREELHVRLSG
jgi:thymidylate kinase